MTTASDYLASIVDQAQQWAPSITLATLQRSTQPKGGQYWKPGIGSFAWGFDGQAAPDAAGGPAGLRFPTVYAWFSDRLVADGGDPWTNQQFDAAGRDTSSVTLTPNGDAVHLSAHSISWGSDLDADSFMFDDDSQQLLFHVPGAGPNAPTAVQIVALHPTGQFSIID